MLSFLYRQRYFVNLTVITRCDFMSRYIPMPAYPDRMPVDISFVFRDEKPAGKHGFVHADGEVLRFEDGTLAKF